MPLIESGFPGLLIYEPTVFQDNRGLFFESFNVDVFAKRGITNNFVQDNQSTSFYGVIRGLHYQLNPYAQSKLIRVLRGKILDIAVDIRKGSPNFGKVFQIELSAENKKQLFIPKGFAHGFAVLSDVAEVLYKCDTYYNRESEGGIIYNDPTLNIDWMIPHEKAIISEKDMMNPPLKSCRNNFVFGD